jgi:hypothetical protein
MSVSNPYTSKAMEAIITVSGETLFVGADGVTSPSTAGALPIDDLQIRECLRWFERAEKTEEATVNSFWLKHFVQHWSGTPVSHGAVIVAAYRSGFPIARSADNASPNVTIGVAQHCIDEYDCGCG